MSSQCFIMNVNRVIPQNITENVEIKPPLSQQKVMSYEEKSVGSTAFFKCEACPYMAFAEDDIKFHLFTVHPDLAKRNGLADNIQITCPGCTSVFDAEETLRTHLRNHHKMGIKDVKKMVKSVVQIALKDAKLKKEITQTDTPVQQQQEIAEVKIPQVIEIVPDINATHEQLPKGVAFISVDELHKMSTPNFEKVDPKEVIQEASINIVYTNDVSTQYVNVSNTGASTNACNLIQMSSVPPDLISSITRIPTTIDSTLSPQIESDPSHSSSQIKPIKKKLKSDTDPEKNGELCSIMNCRIRIKDPNNLSYHRKCHQNGSFQCPECSKWLSSTEQLHTHLWKLHSIDLEMPTCEICGYKTFLRHRLLNIHMKCHDNIKSYACKLKLTLFSY